ncbi:WD40 repeat domain-containing protein [Fischerella sp. JS2]|uniref:WD40 repeat domain-containing protein n=1 Tax=Fischerella sp. JS2 TaxID=2597771 RepID=UPI0037C01D39
MSGSADKTIKIWNLYTGKQVRNLGGWFSVYLDSICSLVITPDDQTLISGSRDHTIKLWNLATGDKQVLYLNTHGGFIL